MIMFPHEMPDNAAARGWNWVADEHGGNPFHDFLRGVSAFKAHSVKKIIIKIKCKACNKKHE